MKKIILILLAYSVSCYCQKYNNGNSDFRIIKNIVIYQEDGVYCGWPVIIKAENGDILTIFCRAEEHHSPTGEAVLARSTDNGNSWLKPVVIRNTPLDDRGGAMVKLKNGAIFSSLISSYHPTEIFAETFVKSNSYPLEILKRWAEYTRTTEYINAKNESGFLNYISNDNGYNWKNLGKGKGFFHNAIELDDSTLLCPYYESHNFITLNRVNPYNNVLTWKTDTLRTPYMRSYFFGEPDVLKLKSGRIILITRTTAVNPYDNKDYKNLLWEAFSDDNGKAWSDFYPLPLWGYPPHLLQLSDGRILCSYGYRRPPYGERACISDDGVTWKAENEIILRADAPNEDLGYPVSLEIEPNIILTIYYQPDLPEGAVQTLTPPMPDRKKPGILGTIWKLPKK